LEKTKEMIKDLSGQGDPAGLGKDVAEDGDSLEGKGTEEGEGENAEDKEGVALDENIVGAEGLESTDNLEIVEEGTPTEELNEIETDQLEEEETLEVDEVDDETVELAEEVQETDSLEEVEETHAVEETEEIRKVNTAEVTEGTDVLEEVEETETVEETEAIGEKQEVEEFEEAGERDTEPVEIDEETADVEGLEEAAKEKAAAFGQILRDIDQKIESGDYEAALEELEKTKEMIKDLSGQGDPPGLGKDVPKDGGSLEEKETEGTEEGEGLESTNNLEIVEEEALEEETPIEELDEIETDQLEEEETLEVAEVDDETVELAEEVQETDSLEEVEEAHAVEGTEEIRKVNTAEVTEETDVLEEVEETETIEETEAIGEKQEVEEFEEAGERDTEPVEIDEETADVKGLEEAKEVVATEEGGAIEEVTSKEVGTVEKVPETIGFGDESKQERLAREFNGGEDIDVSDKEGSDSMKFLSEEIPPDEEFRRDDLLKAKVLAERFEEYLDITKRFYNRHIWIPGGNYFMGSKYPTQNEQEDKRVTLRPFYLGEYPVVNAIFKVFIENTGYKTSAERTGYGEVYEGQIKMIVDKDTGRKSYIMATGVVSKVIEGACWRHPFGPDSSIEGKDNHPVVQVSIEDAHAFAAWTGKRLPSEAEWEAAARSADGRNFPWGNEWKKEYCNFEESYVGDTVPVDYYQDSSMSPFGVRDLLGNVQDWTSTIYEDTSRDNPLKGRYFVVKGGSFINSGVFSPGMRAVASEKTWSNIIGFRCGV